MYRALPLVLLLNSVAMAGSLWMQRTLGDPALTLTILPAADDAGHPQLIAGHDSGRIEAFELGGTDKPRWTARLDGSILAMQPLADVNADGCADVVATTDRGTVACISGSGTTAGKMLWSVNVVFNISQLTIVADTNRDGSSDVAFGGADHRVTLLNGADGKQLWSRYFEIPYGYPYVDCVAGAGDVNGDGVSDVSVRTWGGGHRWAISGVDGSNIWTPQPGSPYLSTLVTAPDLNGDGVCESLQSGNSGVLFLCDGKSGEEIYRTRLGRPIRAIAVSPKAAAGEDFECYAGTASGDVCCVAGTTAETVKTRWTANIDDVCRVVVIQGDIDKDGRADVVAGAENGVVAAFSGADGKPLWKWQGPDTIRTMATLPDLDGDGVSDLAVAVLDGTLILLPGRPAKESVTLVAAEPACDLTAVKPAIVTRSAASPDVKEVPVLLYHDVPPKGLTPAESDPVVNFRDQMDLLVAAGYTSVSLDDLAEWIEGKRDLPARSVVITFDGQYASHDTQLVDILRERGLYAISYITTDWIGTANHLDWHELRRLEKSGCVSIDNHTINHPTLSTVSRDEVVRQLSLSNAAIKRHLGGKVSRHHAYPNGPNNSTARDVLKELGFRTATSVIHRRALRSDNLYNLPRYTIGEQMTLDSFKAIIDYKPFPYPALPYKYVGEVGSNWLQPSYGDVDAEGKLWVCDVSAGKVRVFMPDGKEAPFSPIGEGLKPNGESIQVLLPAGIAVAPNGEVWVSIATRSGTIRHLLRYQAADGKALPGLDVPYLPGDIDTDAAGLLYVVDKLTGQVHIYTSKGEEVPGSPMGENAGLNICRGLAVAPDGSTVYVVSDTYGYVRIRKGGATATGAKYEEAGMLVEKLSNECGAIDVMNDGKVLVSFNDEGLAVAFDADKHIVGCVGSGTFPSFAMPRGTAFTPDGKVIWLIGRQGQVQRWEKQE